MNISDSSATDLKESLTDCGFQEEMRRQYFQYAHQNRTDDLLRLLYRQRKILMDDLHMVQRRVDTVDFIIHSIQQKN